MMRSLLAAALACLSWPAARASEVVGKIELAPKISPKALPPAVYDLRGRAVPGGPKSLAGSRPFSRVAVWLEANDGPAAAPISAAMQQQERRFEPDLLIVPVGSKVAFPNLDPIFHNIFSLSGARSFDLGYYSEGKSRDVVFPRAGIVQVYCHVHPEMYGVIVVTSSPWSARVKVDGTFLFSDVPPGKYRILVWQRSTGLTHRTVKVPQTGSVSVLLKLPAEDLDK